MKLCAIAEREFNEDPIAINYQKKQMQNQKKQAEDRRKWDNEEALQRLHEETSRPVTTEMILSCSLFLKLWEKEKIRNKKYGVVD